MTTVDPHLWWYIARATGIVAWGVLAASVLWGLLLSTRLAHGHIRRVWLADVHRFLGGLGVVFTAFHLGALVADNYTHFGAVDLLVPFDSSWRPAATALGVVALYLLAAVEITSLLMRRLPKRLWKAVHLTSFGLFWLATLHFVVAGSDAHNPVAGLNIVVVAAAVIFLTTVRILSPARRVPATPAPPRRWQQALGARQLPSHGSDRKSGRDDDEPALSSPPPRRASHRMVASGSGPLR